jgi:hypothetical protein
MEPPCRSQETIMTTTTSRPVRRAPNPKPLARDTIRVRTSIKAGGPLIQHGLRVRTRIQAGGINLQHGVRVRSVG